MNANYYAIVCEPATAGADGAVITTVRLSGEFDLGASNDLRDAVLEAVTAGDHTRVAVDLTDVKFIDSETIRVLLEGYTAAQHQGLSYQLINAHGLVLRVLDVMGLTEVLIPGKPEASPQTR